MFLDIQMPEMTGTEVARHVAGRCHVVFVTAYDQYAIQAFENGCGRLPPQARHRRAPRGHDRAA
jgi:DNA-binding LytR/AlgR family response regulator